MFYLKIAEHDEECVCVTTAINGTFFTRAWKKVLLFCHVKFQNSWADGREKSILAGDMIHYEQLSFCKRKPETFHSANQVVIDDPT